MTDRTCGPDSGVYAIVHVPTGATYIGSSYVSIFNRWSWHKSMLKQNKHTCRDLQELYNRTNPEDWSYEILEMDQENDVRAREDFWMKMPKILLNTVKDSVGKSRTHSEETKQKMREGCVRYLETPGARESLAERARAQHEAGKLGRQTWK